MSRKRPEVPTVLTIRVTPELDRRLAREARRRRRTRSQTARTILESVLVAPAANPAADAARQSRLAATRESERDVLDFIGGAADLRGWE